MSDDADFKRDKENKNDYTVINVDEEIQKIVNESMSKAKGTNRPSAVINPFNDIKKVSKPKGPNKLKLIVKQSNRVIVKEIDKTGKLPDEEEI